MKMGFVIITSNAGKRTLAVRNVKALEIVYL